MVLLIIRQNAIKKKSQLECLSMEEWVYRVRVVECFLEEFLY